MNYCTIQDAWGKSNSMTTQMKEYMGNTDNIYEIQKPQSPQPQLNNLKSDELMLLIQNIQKKNNECNNFMEHIKTCNTCYNAMRNKFRSPAVEKIYQLVQENRDTILLILIGIAILLILNLMYNVTKN